METEPKPPQVSQWGGGKLVIENCSNEMADAIKAAILGVRWFAVDGSGAVVTADRMSALPDPVAEPFWGESWQHSKQCGDSVAAYETVEIGNRPDGYCSPHLTIQHLLGYGYDREDYRREALKLQSWGFHCMRSRRGNDGKYWEIWYLPGYFAATGDLRLFINAQRGTPAKPDHKITEKVVDWLCLNARFGTLDVSAQRAAMCAPD